jgi:hypothetical protein
MRLSGKACVRWAGEDDVFRELVHTHARACGEHRAQAECSAQALACSAAQPAEPVVYWMLKSLPEGCDAVQLPCTVLRLDAEQLAHAPDEAAQMVATAALQCVHARQAPPRSHVRTRALLCPSEARCRQCLTLSNTTRTHCIWLCTLNWSMPQVSDYHANRNLLGSMQDAARLRAAAASTVPVKLTVHKCVVTNCDQKGVLHPRELCITAQP